MFINCPFCKALVATDPATDQPPEHCPRCAAKLRDAAVDRPVSTAPREQSDTPALDPACLLQVPARDARPVQGIDGATPSEPSSQIHRTAVLEPSSPASTGPAAVAPIATMLKPAADAAPATEAARADADGDAKPANAAPDPVPAVAPQGTGSANAADVHTTVDADHAVTTAPPASAPDASAEVLAGTIVATGADAAAAPPRAQAPGTTDADAATATRPARAPSAAAPHAAHPVAKALPSFARRRAALGASGLHWKPVAAIVALAMLLALQLLLADRDRLAADARWRPLLANVCGALGCALPPWREPDAFALLARSVRPHPSKPDVLHVTATFRNDARWPQPWPRVRLILSDINGSPVAARDFDARDYLGDAPAQPELRSGQSASIAMDVVESGPRSVAFDFELL